MRVVLISDTHGKHNSVQIPDGEVLVHAGDFTMVGEIDTIQDFNFWLGKLPHKHKIVIAGNHDLSFQRNAAVVENLLTNCTYLKDSGTEIDGVKFWGSPWTPQFGGPRWVFQTYNFEERENIWEKIPKDTNVLITHGPAEGILDRTSDWQFAGDRQLKSAIEDLDQLKIHVSGHIHEAYGHTTILNSHAAYNASILDLAYRVRNAPFVVEV